MKPPMPSVLASPEQKHIFSASTAITQPLGSFDTADSWAYFILCASIPGKGHRPSPLLSLNYIHSIVVLYTIPKNTEPSTAIESAIAGLRTLIAKRLQTHYDGAPFDLKSGVQQLFGDKLIQQEIARHLPQPPTPEEWIILILALTPHIRYRLL